MAAPTTTDFTIPAAGSEDFEQYSHFAPRELMIGNGRFKDIAEVSNYLMAKAGCHQIIHDVFTGATYRYYGIGEGTASMPLTAAQYQIYRPPWGCGLETQVTIRAELAQTVTSGGPPWPQLTIAGPGASTSINVTLYQNWGGYTGTLSDSWTSDGWNTVTLTLDDNGSGSGNVYLKSFGLAWGPVTSVATYNTGAADDDSQCLYWLDLNQYGDQAPVSASALQQMHHLYESWYQYLWQREPIITYSSDWTNAAGAKGTPDSYVAYNAENTFNIGGTFYSRVCEVPWWCPPNCTKITAKVYGEALGGAANSGIRLTTTTDTAGNQTATMGSWQKIQADVTPGRMERVSVLARCGTAGGLWIKGINIWPGDL